ncbi:hypothetical protein Peur_051355 [Populus x canadensis]
METVREAIKTKWSSFSSEDSEANVPLHPNRPSCFHVPLAPRSFIPSFTINYHSWSPRFPLFIPFMYRLTKSKENCTCYDFVL